MLLVLLALPAAIPQAAGAEVPGVTTVTRVPTSEPVVALTFDTGADRGFAAQILDTLAALGVPCSFGVSGHWAEANRDLVRRMAAEGHHVMNHSWSHTSFRELTSAQRVDELRRTDALLTSLTGATTQPYFRPPYGEYDDAVLRDLLAEGYTVNALWSIDSLGWAGLTAAEIRDRVLARAEPGAIVLLHVGAQSQDGPALAGIVAGLRARGYRFARLDDLLGTRSRTFPETGHTVSGPFLQYWNRFGGLHAFGYPISEPFVQGGLTMQYFERVRMELHPGVWPERFNVLLGRLGAELTAQRSDEPPFRPLQAGDDAHCTFFPETGHRLCFGFRAWWRANGGLELLGFPISEEFQEVNPQDGRVYTVQYFERARLEYHPENPPPWDVLGGHLGRTAMGLP